MEKDTVSKRSLSLVMYPSGFRFLKEMIKLPTSGWSMFVALRKSQIFLHLSAKLFSSFIQLTHLTTSYLSGIYCEIINVIKVIYLFSIYEYSSHPFHVTRRGWGEFPLRVQVIFHNPLCKPINIIHHLKLDKSYTGLQTLGAETIVDVMVFGQGFSLVPTSTEDDVITEDAHETGNVCEDNRVENGTNVKQEPEDTEVENNEVEFSNSCNFGLLKPEDIKKEEVSDSQSDETLMKDVTCTVKEEDEVAGSNGPLSTNASKEQVEASDEKECENISEKDIDHDYHRKNTATASAVNSTVLIADRKTKAVAVNKIVVPKSSISQLKLNSLFSKQYVIPSSSGSNNGPVASSSTLPSKPVLVRCLNKNGTPISLPLTLFRSAVVIKPYHLVKPGESLLRPPLIRARHEMQGQVVMKPASAVRIVLPPNAQLPTLLPKLEVKPKEEKIDPESKYLQERKSYDQLISSVQSSRWHSVRDCIRVLARHFSLVDSLASDPIYRSLRPFAAPSLQAFSSWNMGKQRSAEWTRAKLFRNVIEQCKFSSGENPGIWTTKRILIWCRRQGYAPLSCWPDNSKTQTQDQYSGDKPLPSTFSSISVKSSQLASNEEAYVDVETLDASVSEKISQPLCQVRKEVIPLDDTDPDFTSWVCETVEKLGFKLGVEPFDDACASFSRSLLAQIWKNMAEDLIRRSLRESWQRTGGIRPNSILLPDVLSAVIRRPEFDMLTNNGLGSSANSRL